VKEHVFSGVEVQRLKSFSAREMELHEVYGISEKNKAIPK